MVNGGVLVLNICQCDGKREGKCQKVNEKKGVVRYVRED